MEDYIEISHIKMDKRNKKINDTKSSIKKGMGTIFKHISSGISKLAKDIQERQKPENQIKRLQEQKKILEAKAEVMKEQVKIDKLKPKTNPSTNGLGGFVDNANKNIESLFGTNLLNNNKKNGGLI